MPLKPRTQTRPSPTLPHTTDARPSGTTLALALWYVLGVVGFALAYYAAGRIGLAFAIADRSVTLIWPPTGIAPP